MTRTRLAAFCSHGGSNFAAIADAARAGTIPIDPVLMVHNNARAGAKEKAEARGIATVWLPRGRYASDAEYGEALLGVLDEHRVEIIALAGFMQHVPPAVVRRFNGRMTNIHPALLPLFGGPGFYGLRVHQAVFDAGMKVSGPTVHLVNEEYDRGPILMQRAVPIDDCRSPEEIAARVLVEEHRLYPEALGLLAAGRFRLEGRRAVRV